MGDANTVGGMSPDVMNTLLYMLAGTGREIGGHQGVAESLGAPVQQMIQAQNFMKLLQGGIGGQQPGAAPAQAPVQTPAATSKPAGTGAIGTTADKNKITFEGSKLDDITKALSGLSFEKPASQGIGPGASQGLNPLASVSNFLLPR